MDIEFLENKMIIIGEDSLGEPPVDSYDLATAYPQQQQQHSL